MELSDTLLRKTREILNEITQMRTENHCSETQVTSKEHESKVGCILSAHLKCVPLKKELFRKLLSNNDIKYDSEEFKNSPQGEVVVKNPYGITYDQNYIVSQPFGQQNYPDFIVFRIHGSAAKLVYIECKQEKPTWNNTPPKKCKDCVYICGNKVYNGAIILSDYDLKLINDYKKGYEEHVRYFNNLSSEMKFVMYKKIETAQWPTKYFIENEKHNNNYIHETLSRFY
tara:strand:- start:864 stop:1547 length:684 start_codon:yes stop_codon:yes gene_type:complete